MTSRFYAAALAGALLFPAIMGCGSTIVASVPDETVTLAIIDSPAHTMAKNDTHVYWRDGSGLARVSIDGGPNERFPPTNGYHFGVDDSYVYYIVWSSGVGGVMKRPPEGGAEVVLASKDGSGAETTFDMGMPHHLAADAENAYWIDGESGELRRMPLAGGAVVTLATDVVESPWLAVDDTSVY